MRINEHAALIHRADTVRVAICDEAKISHPRTDRARQRTQILGNRFRVDAAKTGVHLAAYFRDLTACPLQKRI